MDMKAMMKQAQKMQRDAALMQEKIAEMEFSSSAGGGAVEAVVSGEGLIKSLTIDPDAVDTEDIEMLQDMIVAALNDALSSAAETASNQMNSVMGGMNIPGLM